MSEQAGGFSGPQLSSHRIGVRSARGKAMGPVGSPYSHAGHRHRCDVEYLLHFLAVIGLIPWYELEFRAVGNAALSPDRHLRLPHLRISGPG